MDLETEWQANPWRVFLNTAAIQTFLEFDLDRWFIEPIDSTPSFSLPDPSSLHCCRAPSRAHQSRIAAGWDPQP